jgi:transposase, IS5 family
MIFDSSEQKNHGKLILDATCAPADIRYPNDLGLLNQAREQTERIIDGL